MNSPPFVRATNHEGDRENVPNPMFAAFYTTPQQQRQMADRLGKIAHGTAYHGNAGEASAFLALAHRKICPEGTLALVMPLSLQFGASWEASRRLLRRHYENLCVISIAAARDNELSFSADTDMAECLITGRRSGDGSQRGTFVIFATETVRSLGGSNYWASYSRRKGDSPASGRWAGRVTPIRVGDDMIGTMLDGAATRGWTMASLPRCRCLCRSDRISARGTGSTLASGRTGPDPLARVPFGRISPFWTGRSRHRWD